MRLFKSQRSPHVCCPLNDKNGAIDASTNFEANPLDHFGSMVIHIGSAQNPIRLSFFSIVTLSLCNITTFGSSPFTPIISKFFTSGTISNFFMPWSISLSNLHLEGIDSLMLCVNLIKGRYMSSKIVDSQI